ncbi:methyltransferase domain-containing protein [Francisella sp. 19X1-34]|uniref:methyltransferase domain-containing protein n=1 Tax=Francisella sp. 19X1-34 TaxID=3087177 RepID=UPI002E339C55|nr:methyltransferase domain-containing protein [Francisella sp. 19X1-34]MED7788966.1 methyltransferase domain-containing protein [Francisella sp. 19X1-34]
MSSFNIKKFENIDASNQSQTFIDALEKFNSTKQIQELKQIARDKIKSFDRATILDAGCGPGFESTKIASEFPNNVCKAVDLSNDFLKNASLKAIDKNLMNLEFQQMDIHSLDFSDSVFEYSRAERVLLYLKEPLQALKELKRVTKNNGYICLIEPDWETNTINITNRQLVRKIINYDCDKNIRSGWIGRQLPRYLKSLDLNFEIETRVVILPQDLAYMFYDGVIQSNYENNNINSQEYSLINKELNELYNNGDLFCTISYFLYICKVAKN